jgi:glycosyltransferase involved in cell wall biosynthesis
MKILYLHQYFNTPDMSGGTRSYEMARRLVKMGHEVYMITSWRENSDHKTWYETAVEGIHVHWLPVNYSNHMSNIERIKVFFKFALFSARKAVSLKVDIIFATSTPLTIALPAVYASRKLKIPMVFEVRDLWPELPIAMGALKNPVTRFMAHRLEKFAYNNAAAVVALSPGMRDGVQRTGYMPNQVAVIPNSSDIDMFRVDSSAGEKFRAQRAWLGDRPLLVYTGTFGLINGVGYMVELAVELQAFNSDVCILLIGNGKEFDKVKTASESVGVLNKNLFIESQLPKKDIPSVLSAATMVSSLFIDKLEMRPNSANKFFDALAAGKPVMINYGGWMHDLIASRGCGLAMWQIPLNFAAIKLDEVMHNQDWLSKASLASAELASKYFDRDVLVQELESVLIKTLNGQADQVSKIAPGYYPNDK